MLAQFDKLKINFISNNYIVNCTIKEKECFIRKIFSLNCYYINEINIFILILPEVWWWRCHSFSSRKSNISLLPSLHGSRPRIVKNSKWPSSISQYLETVKILALLVLKHSVYISACFWESNHELFSIFDNTGCHIYCS